MGISESKYQELLEKYRELQMVCEIWIAASEMKDERITELEAELAHAQQRVGRLGRLVGRNPAEPSRKRAKQAR